jgi:predicted small metal-binding protein
MPGQLIVCPCGTVLRGIGLEEIVAEGCDGVVTGATEEDVLAAAAVHAAESHGMAEVPAEEVDAIRAGITRV